MCKCVLLPPGDSPIAVNKYIISMVTRTRYIFNVYTYVACLVPLHLKLCSSELVCASLFFSFTHSKAVTFRGCRLHGKMWKFHGNFESVIHRSLCCPVLRFINITISSSSIIILVLILMGSTQPRHLLFLRPAPVLYVTIC